MEDLAAEADKAGSSTAEMFQRTARNVVRVLREKLLPFPEPLDAKVRVAGLPSPVPRDDVQIILEGVDQPRKLRASGFDEFRPADDGIKGVRVGATYVEVTKGANPFLPTEYSQAIHEYNEERFKMKDWNAEEMRRLLSVCEKHSAALEQGPDADWGGKTLIPRIKRLLEIAMPPR